jgi:threonine synthase
MKYESTRGGVAPIDFQQAVMMGLAEDGGLIIPESIPDVRSRLDEWRDLPYVDLACEVIGLYATDIPADDLRGMIERAYEAFPENVAPVREVGELHVLELFHGPTLAFKDVALQLLGYLFEYILARRGGRLNILGATSGDTGSAAIAGVRGREGIDIFVMHPEGRTSPIQERQMTTVLDENVHNIAVRGSFDDCQRIMKTLAGDLEFKRRYALGAVNSVNWARVLAQIVYYFHGVFRVQKRTGQSEVDVTVPTGNFGDILAGWYARRMGVPIGRLICATNQNDILARFFHTGEYSLGEVHRSHSPSMDIQVASNFERYLYYLLDEDPEKLKAKMSEFAETGALTVPTGENGVDPTFVADRAGEEQTLAAIQCTWERFGYVLDPHTAVGVHVATDRVRPEVPMLSLATAHPAKFPAAIAVATGREDIATHPEIEKLSDLPARCTTLDNDVEAVRAFIEETVEPVA